MCSTPAIPFNDLPYELQREGSEMVRLHSTELSPNDHHALINSVILVNRIQPYIYHMVTLGEHDADLFIRTVDSKPPEFFAVHVERLCLSVSVPPAKASRILNVCKGAVDLALWVDFGGKLPPTGAAAYVSSLSLKRLSIEHEHLLSFLSAPRTISPPWYKTLTHLEIVFWKHTASPTIPGLDKLTSLTHLTLGLRHSVIEEPWLSAIVASCPRLQVLVPLADEDDPVEDTFLLGKCWIVPMHYPPSVVENWEASFWGLPDIFTRAQEEIQLKQSSESSKRAPSSEQDAISQ
ncbi:hypothetical protein EST38_g4633 [Candolleomyces aberdarensis]|uniref:Uncharacterized protein n=1 Tax=Candolleomyces aberdarensis TaxID=2316362 RepID=A0A4Q2DMH9_9AGAR|nr:hypothetical protein EST38_g4633 [Candolleomyces aberdarensis]